MADLNALIAQGAQFKAPVDPFAQYAQMQQLEQASSTNQLNRMKMEEMQAANTERNALRQLDPTSPDYESQLFKVNPTMGIAYRKEASAAAAQQATQKAQQAEALKTNLANHRSFLVGVNDQPSYDAWRALTIKNIPDLASILPAQFSPDTKDGLLKTADDMSKRLTAAPPAPPASVAEFNFAKTPEGGNFKGSYQNFVTAKAAAGRAPVQPVAPTITQIVDPANPNQMITIDARRYQGGGAGSLGVIGVAGKEPGAALRTNKVEAGKSQLADDLDNLRFSFQTLDELRAIPSTDRNVVSNLMSASAASGLGQTLGRAGGSPEQVERDVINSARQRLVNSIKNATGMSAQQLNSNVELQTMLKSISDPGQSIQAAMRIIDDIENAYVKGNGTLPKRNMPSGAPAAAAPAAASNVVVTPDGQSHTFPTPAAAAQFKKAAGIK